MSPSPTGRMMAPIAILSILLLILAFGSAWYVRSAQRSMSDAMTHNMNSVRAAPELEISILEIRKQFDRYLITQDEAHLKPIPELKAKTSEALADAEQVASTPEEQELMKRTRSGYEHFFREYERILNDRQQFNYAKIMELIDGVLQKEIFEPANEYTRVNEDMLIRNAADNRKLSDRISLGMVAIGLFGSMGGLLAGAFITVAIRRSIQKTELQVRTTAVQLDEAAFPGRSIRDIDENPKDAIVQIHLAASAVLNRLKQTEQDALRAEQLAWAGQMAAGIAHEIRNPLMSIKLLVQATAEKRAGGFKPQDLQVLEEEIVRLEQIVSGFLDFARPPKLVPLPVDVREIIQRAVNGVQAKAELQGVKISFDSGSEPAVISADQNQINQVIFNLLFNALDAQPNGGNISLRVGTDSLASPQPTASIIVEDAGSGIPTKVGNSIFKPFFSTKETGMGLGLSICLRIVESHGGTITYTSGSTGTTFVVRLPLAQVSDPNDLQAIANA